MSFSGEIKAELCRAKLARECCARAEAMGVLLFCNQFSQKGIRIVTESADFATRLPELFRRAFGLRFDRVPPVEQESGKRRFAITQTEKLQEIFAASGWSMDSIAQHVNFALLEEAHCQQSFLRGVFLAGGSVTDPQKGYHMEMVTTHYHVSGELAALLLDLGYPSKKTQRKSNDVIYFKQSEHIEDMLTVMGAPVGAMAIMNAKAEKQLRNGVNRRVNCDAANADKTVEAAQEQLHAIRRLRESGALLQLGEKLQEAAELREAHPELSLTELARLCEPAVSKSCLNHRLRRLVKEGSG